MQHVRAGSHQIVEQHRPGLAQPPRLLLARRRRRGAGEVQELREHGPQREDPDAQVAEREQHAQPRRLERLAHADGVMAGEDAQARGEAVLPLGELPAEAGHVVEGFAHGEDGAGAEVLVVHFFDDLAGDVGEGPGGCQSALGFLLSRRTGKGCVMVPNSHHGVKIGQACRGHSARDVAEGQLSAWLRSHMRQGNQGWAAICDAEPSVSSLIFLTMARKESALPIVHHTPIPQSPADLPGEG